MISTLIKAPARTAVGTVRLVYRPSVWLVRTMAGVALKSGQRGRPEPEPGPRSNEPQGAAKPPPPSRRRSASTSTPRTPRRSESNSEPRTARSSASTSEPRTARSSASPGKPRTARSSASPGKPRTARSSAAPSKPRTERRSRSTGQPESARRRTTGNGPAQAPPAAETSVTLPPADPEHPGIPGRDAPPALPSEPHHMLNTPVGEPDPTEWPDPYDRRPDPRHPNTDEPLPLGDDVHPPTGAQSTSEPHPGQDPEAVPPRARER